MKKIHWILTTGCLVVLLGLILNWAIGCSQNSSLGTPTTINSGGSGSSSSSCTVTANTSDSTTVTSGCYLLNRNASSCSTSRTALGLTGAWQKFSCNVSMALTVSGGATFVQLTSKNLPDYTSNYFTSTSPCYVAFTTSYADPNVIAAQSVTVDVPLSPGSAGSTMSLGIVGMAIDGVVIYDNQAAPGDNIFDELGSFDECQGHPDVSSMYHYHTEPYAISHDDDNLIGVMSDGYFIYGRLDPSGSPGSLDSAGGHTSATVDSATPVYHYHLNLQTGVNTAGVTVSGWFLTTGSYHGTPGYKYP